MGHPFCVSVSNAVSLLLGVGGGRLKLCFVVFMYRQPHQSCLSVCMPNSNGNLDHCLFVLRPHRSKWQHVADQSFVLFFPYIKHLLNLSPAVFWCLNSSLIIDSGSFQLFHSFFSFFFALSNVTRTLSSISTNVADKLGHLGQYYHAPLPHGYASICVHHSFGPSCWSLP